MKLSNERAGFTLAEGATHVAHCGNSCKLGFTLAEVLITLGIIGVVAAMTMPTLMNQTNGAQYKAAYKKALSAISQGVTLNVALDGGSFADTIAGEAGKTTAGNGKSDDTKTEGVTVASLLNSRMNIVKASGVPNKYTFAKGANDDSDITQASADTYLFFNDGSMLAFKTSETFGCQAKDTEAGIDGKVCKGFIDVNGLKGPNKVVTCDNGTYKNATKAEGNTQAQGADSSKCVVSNPTDIYPVEFYDQTIVPASAAARAVLYGK